MAATAAPKFDFTFSLVPVPPSVQGTSYDFEKCMRTILESAEDFTLSGKTWPEWEKFRAEVVKQGFTFATLSHKPSKASK